MVIRIVQFLLGHLVVAQMLWIGLAVTARDFMDVRRRPEPYLRALVVMELGVVVFTMAIVRLLDVPPRLAALFLLMAACAGAPMIPRAARRDKAEHHSAFALNLLLLISLLAPFTVPAWVWVISRMLPLDFHVSAFVVFKHTLSTVLLPLGLGIVLRRILPLRIGNVIARVAHAFFVAALVAGVIAAVHFGAPALAHLRFKTIGAAFVIVGGAAALGYLSERRFPDARRPTGIAAALGNPGLVLAVVATSYPGFHGAALIAGYVLFRKLALLPFDLWMKQVAFAPDVGAESASAGDA